MKPGSTIHAAQLAGDFTLPAEPETKIAFLAGGIGITPFRCMLQYLLDRKERAADRHPLRNRGPAGHRLSRRARRCQSANSASGRSTPWRAVRERGQYPGYIDERLVRVAIPDYLERTFYISGPQAMVKALRQKLLGMGVRRSKIKVDYFPGFA